MRDSPAKILFETPLSAEEVNNAMTWLQGIGGGAAQGAATGAAGGPWGALIGGLVGAGLGALQTAQQQQAPPQAQPARPPARPPVTTPQPSAPAVAPQRTTAAAPPSPPAAAPPNTPAVPAPAPAAPTPRAPVAASTAVPPSAPPPPTTGTPQPSAAQFGTALGDLERLMPFLMRIAQTFGGGVGAQRESLSEDWGGLRYHDALQHASEHHPVTAATPANAPGVSPSPMPGTAAGGDLDTFLANEQSAVEWGEAATIEHDSSWE